MKFCDLSYSDHLCSHIKKKSLGRYNVTPFKSIKNWAIGKELLRHMEEYGYGKSNQDIKTIDKIKIYLVSLKRMIIPFFRNFS